VARRWAARIAFAQRAAPARATGPVRFRPWRSPPGAELQGASTPARGSGRMSRRKTIRLRRALRDGRPTGEQGPIPIRIEPPTCSGACESRPPRGIRQWKATRGVFAMTRSIAGRAPEEPEVWRSLSCRAIRPASMARCSIPVQGLWSGAPNDLAGSHGLRSAGHHREPGWWAFKSRRSMKLPACLLLISRSPRKTRKRPSTLGGRCAKALTSGPDRKFPRGLGPEFSV